jgi:hypothetical protein
MTLLQIIKAEFLRTRFHEKALEMQPSLTKAGHEFISRDGRLGKLR